MANSNPITVSDKNTGDQLTASEFNQLLDALKSGTRDITTKGIAADSNVLFVDAGNNLVGIGKSTGITERLDVDGYVNADSGFKVNGTDINTGGTLSNVAYLDQPNMFTSSNTFGGAIAIQNNLYYFFRNVGNSSSSAAFIADTNNDFNIIYNASNLGNDFVIDSYTTEIARFKSNGNVGIGTTIPIANFEVVDSATEGIPTLSAATTGNFQRNSVAGSSNYISIISGTTGVARLAFGDKDLQSAGYIQYDNSTNDLTLASNGTPRVTVDDSGNVGIGIDIPNAKIDINQDNNAIALNIDTEATTADAIFIDMIDSHTGNGIDVQTGSSEYTQLMRSRSDANGTNHFYRNLPSSATAGPVVFIEQDAATDDQPALKIQNDGTGNWLDLITGANDTATSATAGANGDVPAQVVGYLVINIDGTNRKIPYYAA